MKELGTNFYHIAANLKGGYIPSADIRAITAHSAAREFLLRSNPNESLNGGKPVAPSIYRFEASNGMAIFVQEVPNSRQYE